ncbi:MAG: CFI-box-CTERM domain-containing protein [Bacteriovorax sp.]|nr:CFI-box-CTERM domain-containing protein [Bacteriovorax sp.]
MAKKKDNSKELKDERKREQLVELYRTRLTHLKRAQLLVRDDRMAQAVESYTKYLGILALYFDTTEDKLSPSMFDSVKDMTELLLISHAYWDLAKAFDRSPNLQRDCLRCLDQFVRFSIGFKYQHVNAQIIRKFNNKKQAHNPKAFEAAYHKIQISSKKCYIATSCFGEENIKTNFLRHFKTKIAHYRLGKDFIDFYYQISPKIIEVFQDHPSLKWFCEKIFIMPLLTLFIFLIRPYVEFNKTNS